MTQTKFVKKDEVQPESPRIQSITPWASRLAGISLGELRSHGGLTLYPLRGARDGSLDYRTLDDALRTGTVVIREINASGSVPELELENKGDRRVLLVDGEELIGAKQNRIVNTSVLVDIGVTLKLPVTCVEAGRWRAESAAFHSSGTHYNARGRQKKVDEVTASVAASGAYRADQGRVWADVGAKLSNMAVPSPTQSLNAVAQAHGSDLDTFRQKLGTPGEDEVGAIYALGPEIVGLDLFDQHKTQTALLPKLVTSYALDAIEENLTTAPPPSSAIVAWLKTLNTMTGASNPGVGLGEDVRLSASGVSGAALVFQGTVIHLSAFRSAQETSQVQSGMARASLRHRHI